MAETMFALVDCNNFFVSCERVFRPDLADKPVAVLSNNDGCIVARSNEVKALGVPMGAPEFKWRDVLRQHRVQLFSANFHLYGDFSRRVVEILEQYTPYIEVYSVDESFLEVGSLVVGDYKDWADGVRRDVWRQTGIPVSVGVGPTKTLAKAAAEYAKKHPESGGTGAFLGGRAKTGKMLRDIPVEDVWGIGRKLAPRLRAIGIRTAADLAALSPKWARQNLSLHGERMVRELQGQVCYGLSREAADDGQKSIAATRSFGHNLRAMHELEPAMASFASRAAVRLRRQHQIAGALTVFINTGAGAVEPYRPSFSMKLPYPTADTSVLTATALEGLSRIYSQNHAYRRAGVVLHGLLPESAQQTTLEQTGKASGLARRDRLMKAVDGINKRYGTKTAITTASEGAGMKHAWHSKQERRSPAYTTNWLEIPVIG